MGEGSLAILLEDKPIIVDERMVSPQYTRHVKACRVLYTTQQSTTIKKRIEITDYLTRLCDVLIG